VAACRRIGPGPGPAELDGSRRIVLIFPQSPWEDGQRGGRVGGQPGAELEAAGQGRGADDADQGVARQA
jgi:hypothetical protein